MAETQQRVPPPGLTPVDMCRALRVSYTRMYRAIAEGKLEVRRTGRHWMILTPPAEAAAVFGVPPPPERRAGRHAA